MKLVNMRKAQTCLRSLIRIAQKEPVILTRHGKAVAVLRGIDSLTPEEAEDVNLGLSKRLWRQIERARNDPRPSLSEAQVKARYGIGRKKKPARQKGRR